MAKKKGQILSDLNKRGVKGKKQTQSKRIVKDQRIIDFIDLVDCDEKWIKKEEEFILPNNEDEENVLMEAINKSKSLKKKRVKKGGDEALRYKCSKCSRSYANKCHLNRHMNSHNPKYKCKLCKKVYVRINDHRTHMKMHKNGGVKPFKCVICDKGFTRKENLNTHLQLHSSGKRFDCSICGKKFSSKMNKNVHMSTHAPNHKSQRILKCHHCGRTSTTKRGMMFHMQVHMTGYKPKDSKKRKKESAKTVKEVKTEK